MIFFLPFPKDMELDSAIPQLYKLVISSNDWSYICRCREELLLFKEDFLLQRSMLTSSG